MSAGFRGFNRITLAELKLNLPSVSPVINLILIPPTESIKLHVSRAYIIYAIITTDG